MKMWYFTFTSPKFIISIISNLLKGISLNIHFKTASGAGWPGFLTVPVSLSTRSAKSVYLRTAVRIDRIPDT